MPGMLMSERIKISDTPAASPTTFRHRLRSLECELETLGAGNNSPLPAISSGEAAHSMGSGSSPSDERTYARQDKSYLGVLARLAIDLYRPGMLLHNDVVTDGQA